MTDKDNLTTDNTTEDPENTSQNVDTNDLDVEGALAALASLQELTHEAEDEDQEEDEQALPQEPEESGDVADETEIQEFERVGTEEDESSEPVVSSPSGVHDVVFPRPPVSVLHRGQLSSIVPALLMIGIGGYLTFAVTTSGITLEMPIIAALLTGGLGAILLAQWISSSRWSIGSFFLGVLLLLAGGTLAYLILPNQLGLIDGYPLIITAIGTAFVITDLFVPSGRRIWLIGLILALAGLAGLVATTYLVQTDVFAALGGLLPVAVVILIVLLVAPLVRRS